MCSKELKHRDSRKRICRLYGGKEYHIRIRRLQCTGCGTLHNELPNILLPHKHYAAEVIENVVDEVVTSEDEITEDYPCVSTMERWQKWIFDNTAAIDGVLRSLGHRLLDFSEDLLLSSDSLLHKLRSNGPEWLSTVMHTIYNAGCSVPT